MSELVRKGECKRCGKCCRDIQWLWTYLPPRVEEWLLAHEPKAKIERSNSDEPEWASIGIPHTCKQLVDNGDGTFDCRLHDATKPEICKIHPVHPDMLELGCGYWFEEIA